MEGVDRPLFPELLPIGMSIPGRLLPIALKPFPTKQEQKAESAGAEEALEKSE